MDEENAANEAMTCYLTTFDNPYDPETQFDDWFNFDIEMGYYSLGYLDRIARISPSMSEVEKDLEYERAINEIIKYDFRNIYTRVYKPKEPLPEDHNEEKSLDDLLKEISYTRGARP